MIPGGSHLASNSDRALSPRAPQLSQLHLEIFHKVAPRDPGPSRDTKCQGDLQEELISLNWQVP